MGWMDDVMADDAAAIGCDLDGFAEPITYFPYAGPAGGQAMSGIVKRGVLKPASDETTQQSRELHLLIPIGDAPVGRQAINQTKDQVLIVKQIGQPAVKLTVTAVLSQSGGMWKLKVG